MTRNTKSFYLPVLFLALSAMVAAGCNDSPFTVAVDRPLRVVYMNPGPSQQSVALEAQVTVVFSEAVQEAGFKDEKIFSVQGSAGSGWTVIAGSAAWDAASKTLSFKPAQKLAYSATYRIHLGAGLTKVDTTDTSGGHLPSDIDAVFTTVDPPGLTVVSSYPSNGAAGVAPDARVVITFSRLIDQEKPSFDPAASFVVDDTADPAAPAPIAGAWVFDDAAGYTVATFTPADPKDAAKAGQFGYSRVVRLTLSRDVRSVDAKGIKDSAAEKDRKVGHLPATVTVAFSTAALPVLSVASISPAPGSHGVPTDATVTAAFSEPVDQGSVVTAEPTATFVVKDLLADAVIPGALAWSTDGTAATFTPSSPFGYSRQVGVELKSGIRSVRALALVNPPPDRKAIDGYLVPAVAASFSTVDPPDLLLVDSMPDPGSDNIARETPVRLVFSEPVDTVPFAQYPTDLTVAEYAIRIVDITDPTRPSLIAPRDPAAPVAFSMGDSVVTFTPAIPWGWSRTYQVELSMAVKSKRATQISGSLPQAIAFTFKTLDPPPFALVAAAPPASADSIGIDSQLWWTFSAALDPRTLVRQVAEGAVASAGTDAVTVAGAVWPENSLAGDYLTLSKAGEPDVYAFIISNTADTATAEAPLGAAVDATWTFVVDEPSIRLSLRVTGIAPASLAAPFGLGGDLLESGTATGGGTGTLIDAAKMWTEGGLSSTTLLVTGGTGDGQVRSVLHSDATTLYLDAPWDVSPDATSIYEVRRFTTVTFVPAKHLAYDAEYHVDLAGGTDAGGDPKGVTSAIATREGGHLTEPISYSFTTVEPPPLLVAWTSPSDKADSIDPDTSVVITFSEDVDPATLAGNITFTNAGGTAVPYTLAPQGVPASQVTFTPAQADTAWPRLAYSTGYTVTLAEAVASVRGGRLPSAFTFAFKTLDPPPLALVSAMPTSGPQAGNEGVKRETAPDSGVPSSYVLAFSEGIKRAIVDTDGDGKLTAADHGNVKVEDVSALAAADVGDPSKPGIVMAGALAWNDTDAPKAGSWGRGDDTALTFTPAAVPGYSTLVRITVRGQDDPSCADSSSCTLADAVTSDRATAEGGQLGDTVVVLFRIEDPPLLALTSVVNASGLATQPRDAGGGAPDSMLVTFSEGVRQTLATLRSASNATGTVIFEDVTGKANPLTDAANGYIDASLAFLDYLGAPAVDAAPGTSGVGKDAVVRITPNALLGYGTVARLTLVAKDAPDLTAIQSDRATTRGGQLPACRPATGHACVGGNYVFIVRVEALPPLSVISFIPGNRTAMAGAGAQGVAFNQATITAVYSEALDCASVTAANAPVVWDSTDPVGAGTAVTGSWACAGDTATFTTASAFGYSRDILTTLGTSIRSARSVYSNPSADPLMGHLQSSLAYRFSTVNPPEIRVLSVKPGSGSGTLVSGHNPSTTKDTVVMTFSEGVRRDVEQLGLNILVEDVTGPAVAIPGALAWNAVEGDDNADLSGKDNVATFTPTSNWAFGTKVRLTFTGGTPPPLDKLRSDRATVRGGQLLSTQTYDLQVEGLPDLQVVSVTPGFHTTVPGGGAQGADPAGQTIVAVFSEALDCASITAVTAPVTWDTTDPSSPGTAIGGGWGCAGDTATFTTTSTFGYSRDVLAAPGTSIRSARAALANASLSPAIGLLTAAYEDRFTTEDPEAPVVVSMTPGPVSTGVPRTATAAVTFDRAMDTASFTDTTFKVCDTTNDAACAVNICPPARLAFSNGNATVTCTPASALAFSAAIGVSLYGGSTGLDSTTATARGGWFAPQPDPFTYTFSIENLPPLTVLATNFSGSGTYSLSQQLEFIFSDWINWTAVQGPPARIFLVKVSDPATPIAATLNEPLACTAGNACKLTLVPTLPLDYATPYLAVVLGGYAGGVCRPERNATDTDGCIPSLPVEGTTYAGLGFNFTTESTPGLEVSATVPADNDTGVQLLPTLSVTFNNELEPATVSTTSICLTQGNNLSTDCSGPSAVAINAWALSPDGRTVTSAPVAPLSYNTWYTLVVTKAVFDRYGQSLTAYYTAAFQTMTSALIQDIVVFNGNDLVAPNNLYVRVRFTEAMDAATISSSSMYLTYADGFDVTVAVPSIVSMPDAQTAVLTPDLAALYACDDMKAVASGNDGSTDTARPQSLRSTGTLFDSSYVGKIAYVRSALGTSGYYAITGIDTVTPGVDQRLLLSGASFATETGVEWGVMEAYPVLPYSTTYTMHLLTTISNAAHTKHVDPLAGQSEFLNTFATGTGPALAFVTYKNHVVAATNLYSAADVPVNAKFTAAFNEVLDPATVGNGTVLVEERRGSDGAITTPATFTSASAAFVAGDVGKRIFVTGSYAGNNGLYTVSTVVNATTITVSPNFVAAESPTSWGLVIDGSAAGVIGASTEARSVVFDTTKLPALLKYDTRYRFLLVGRYAGGPATVLRLANGNPVLGLHAAAFATSPAMTVTTNQKTGVAISQMMVTVAMFSRPLNTGSFNDGTFYATQQGIGTLTAMFATSAEFPNYITYIPVPTWRQSGTGAVVTITTGVQDYRGNPMPSNTTVTYSSVSNAPATTSIILDPPTSVVPNAGSIAADQEFTLSWVVAGNSRNVLHPASFGAASLVLVEDPAGAAAQVPTISRVVPGGNTVGDKVFFRPTRALKGGVAYRLTLVPANMANLYHIASTDPNTVYNYTCETTVPALGANQVTPSAVGQAPTTDVTAWFTEQIDLKTVSTSTFTVRVNGTAVAISGAYRQEYDSGAGQWKVIFTPSRPLKNTVPNVATSYDVILTNGIKDLAGNAFAGQTFLNRFGVTGNAPLLVSHTPAAGATGVGTGAQVVYNFNAAIDPVTAYAPTSTTPGSVGLAYTDGCAGSRTIHGCVRLQDSGRQVVYRSATPYRLPSSTVVTADFDATKVADLAGNLAGKNGQAPWIFTVAAANPIGTCHAVNAGAGTVRVSFTDTINPATVSAATFAVFNVTTGAALAGARAVAGKDVTFTNAGAIPAGSYGVMATTSVQSVAGSGLLTDYHAYFTVP